MLDRAHDAKFDAQYEQMLKEKGLPVSKQTTKQWNAKQLQPKNIQDYVTLKINLPADDEVRDRDDGYRRQKTFEIQEQQVQYAAIRQQRKIRPGMSSADVFDPEEAQAQVSIRT